ncbi:MAG TPA: hypothetical protein VEW92_03770 [Nitrososphaeraceae archaeon]|nr:hypothetical protein [Nitrososphaeraceae archaeon]
MFLWGFCSSHSFLITVYNDAGDMVFTSDVNSNSICIIDLNSSNTGIYVPLALLGE